MNCTLTCNEWVAKECGSLLDVKLSEDVDAVGYWAECVSANLAETKQCRRNDAGKTVKI